MIKRAFPAAYRNREEQHLREKIVIEQFDNWQREQQQKQQSLVAQDICGVVAICFLFAIVVSVVIPNSLT